MIRPLEVYTIYFTLSILDGHVKNFTTWVCSQDFWDSLTPEQQQILEETGKEAGVFNNELQKKAEQDVLEKFKQEGVTVVDSSPEVMKGFRDRAKAFYSLPDFKDWSAGLYDTVKKAMQK